MKRKLPEDEDGHPSHDKITDRVDGLVNRKEQIHIDTSAWDLWIPALLNRDTSEDMAEKNDNAPHALDNGNRPYHPHKRGVNPEDAVIQCKQAVFDKRLLEPVQTIHHKAKLRHSDPVLGILLDVQERSAAIGLSENYENEVNLSRVLCRKKNLRIRRYTT
jgi:hypothetical protein